MTELASLREAPGQVQTQAGETKKDRSQLGLAGWIMEEGTGRGVRVAPWVVEQKNSLYNSLVGFLKSNAKGLKEITRWIETCWGRRPHNVQLIDERVVWLQFSTPREVEKALFKAASRDCSSPFSMVERWMEVLGSPLKPT